MLNELELNDPYSLEAASLYYTTIWVSIVKLFFLKVFDFSMMKFFHWHSFEKTFCTKFLFFLIFALFHLSALLNSDCMHTLIYWSSFTISSCNCFAYVYYGWKFLQVACRLSASAGFFSGSLFIFEARG